MARIYEFKKQIPPSATDTFAPDEKNVAARRKKHIESHPDRADGALNRHAGFEPLATPPDNDVDTANLFVRKQTLLAKLPQYEPVIENMFGNIFANDALSNEEVIAQLDEKLSELEAQAPAESVDTSYTASAPIKLGNYATHHQDISENDAIAPAIDLFSRKPRSQ